MERNKYFKLNPQKCEPYLSDFGKKVLRVLMNQWDKAREHKLPNEYQQSAQKKKILNFDDNFSYNTPAVHRQLSPPIQIYDADKTFQINIANDIDPEVPTSAQLTKSLQIHETINYNEFAHPTIISSNIVQQDVCEKSYGVEYDHQEFENEHGMFKHADRNETSDVNWDNMFDTELLGDVTANISSEERINSNPPSTMVKETGNIDRDIITNTKETENSGVKRKNKKLVDLKPNKKHRKENTKTIAKPKKANKTITEGPFFGPTISFRKQKYTKTVKEWLNDVELVNANNEDIGTEDFNNLNNDDITTKPDEDIQPIRNKTELNNKTKITIDKSLKGTKKVVQSKLANKNGIMKFSKPNIEVTEHKKAEGCDSKLTKEKQDKVAKKFIPPIKSQIPVKDVMYEIITVDDRNVQKYCDELINVEEGIFVILIFSNGFCQLNGHFTDGTCAADSVLLGAGDVFYCFKGAGQKFKEALTRILVNNKIVISYDARTVLIHLTSHLQMEINTINMFDAKIGASLLDPDNPPENFSDLQKFLSYTPSYTIATECPLQKAAWYTTILKECWAKLSGMLVEQQLWQIFVGIEMKLLPIVAEMERRGVSIDLSKLKSMEEVLVARMRLVEQECYKAVGKVFQINSTVQVRSILYDELQLDAKCNVKIRETIAGGVKSTSETMLRSLVSVHPLPKLILEYRHLHKAHATFLAGIAQHVKDGIVRPTWVQTAAATGRIASNNPNLQAIPKTPFNLVMFPDADDVDSLQLNFRSVYVSRPGWSFVAADFKHVECRVFASAAADTGLLRALTHSDDLFKVLAGQWLSKPENAVTAAERERTKRLVYASLYGAGTRKLMEILDVSYEQALQVAASFNRTFPSLKCFGRHVVSQCCQAGGRLATLCGRVRHFAHITSEDFNLRSHAERQAVNFVVQGSAADLCKTAMILTEEQLRSTTPPVEARLVLQIHDELVWEVSDPHVHAAAGIIKRVMEGCGQHCGMSMSLPVAVSVGKNWGQMEDYTTE